MGLLENFTRLLQVLSIIAGRGNESVASYASNHCRNIIEISMEKKNRSREEIIKKRRRYYRSSVNSLERISKERCKIESSWTFETRAIKR